MIFSTFFYLVNFSQRIKWKLEWSDTISGFLHILYYMSRYFFIFLSEPQFFQIKMAHLPSLVRTEDDLFIIPQTKTNLDGVALFQPLNRKQKVKQVIETQ